MVGSRRYTFEGNEPEIHEQARVSREATLVGDVTIGADASVWPGAVLRGDVDPVHVGDGAHIGDTAVLHASTVGEGCMVGHGAVLDESTVADGALVGFNATLNAGTTIGEDSVIAAGTVVPPEYEVPADSFARGVPAEITPLEETTIDRDDIRTEYSSGAYTDLAKRHDDLFE